MKNNGTLLALSLLFAGPAAQAQFTAADVQFWVGAGPDSSVLVIDFQDGSATPSHAWGWLHSGGTGEDMVQAIAAADPALTVELVGGFLNSITYAGHAGIGGEPDWWSTWDGTGIDDMVSNLGLAGTLGNGDWLGCSYTDFNPALPPTEPVPAMLPTGMPELAVPVVQAFPQPATDLLQVRTNATSPWSLALYSLTGERLWQETVAGPEARMDVRGLAAGIYVLQAGAARSTIVIQ